MLLRQRNLYCLYWHSLGKSQDFKVTLYTSLQFLLEGSHSQPICSFLSSSCQEILEKNEQPHPSFVHVFEHDEVAVVSVTTSGVVLVGTRVSSDETL